ncbi:MAG: hypothetical protein FWC24_01440 [Treponema sp.]|nr:hypothetical protein [Treponema sp.]
MHRMLHVTGVFLGMLIFLGCKSSPAPEIESRMPLTVAIAQRLSTSDSSLRGMDRLQLYLFGRITLEREHSETSQEIDHGVGRMINEHIRDTIIIPDRTPCLAINVDQKDNDIFFYIAFDESEKSNENGNLLKFSSKADNPDGFFELQFNHNDDEPLSGDEKGSLNYKGNTYKVKYVGDIKPHLLVQLTLQNKDTPNMDVLHGIIVK